MQENLKVAKNIFFQRLVKWFSNLLLTADTISDLEALRDMKNLSNEKLSTKLGLPEKVIDYLNPTEDGESSEEAHSASYQTQLGFHCHLITIFKATLSDAVRDDTPNTPMSPSHPFRFHHRLQCQSR